MARRHLRELLKEDQEPFQLSDYITDRRRLLNRPPPPQEAQIQVKRRNRIFAAAFPVSFRRNVCFYSFHDSPDLRKSPRFEFPKSPCKTPHNAIFLQIPARTAAVLLEAALRIHRHSSSTTETKPPKGQFGFRFFGSVFKKLTHRNRNRASEIGVAGGVEAHVSNARLSSAVWSKRNDGKSLDLKASHGSNCEEDESYKVTVSDSQESPFRFVLHRSPSSGDSTPEFPSPATSPTLDKEEENVKTKGAGGDAEEEEEDKEQSSPVSVLDPLFNDDDDTHEDGFGIDCSSVIVQRTKQQLSEKARGFNNNAALDPVELDKRMEKGREGDDVFESALSRVGNNNEMGFREFLRRPPFCHMWQIPADMERLVSELIVEERLKPNDSIDDGEAVAERVSQRLEAWKQVESNTIDMMVEMDLRMELNGRKGSTPQVGDVAVEIEVAIFGLLVNELSEEVNAFGYQVCRCQVCGGTSHGHHSVDGFCSNVLTSANGQC